MLLISKTFEEQEWESLDKQWRQCLKVQSSSAQSMQNIGLGYRASTEQKCSNKCHKYWFSHNTLLLQYWTVPIQCTIVFHIIYTYFKREFCHLCHFMSLITLLVQGKKVTDLGLGFAAFTAKVYSLINR